MDIKPITRKVYQAILRYKQMNQGNSPSHSILENELGMSSGLVSQHIEALVAVGLLQKTPKRARYILIPGALWISPQQRKKLEQRLEDAGISWDDVW